MNTTESNDLRESAFEPLLDSREAARMLRIHPKTLQRFARRGEIAAIQIGKLWRFRASDLDRWLRAHSSRGPVAEGNHLDG